MTPYSLPELDSDYSALEPHMSNRIMEPQHSKHHAAYVKNANEAVARLEEACATGDYTQLASLERTLAFNLSRPHPALHFLEEPRTEGW